MSRTAEAAMVHPARGQLQSERRRPTRAGFTLIDVLVSLAVVGLLLALLSPVISEARHAAWRVVCANNVRQVGLGIALYADDYKQAIPPTVFVQERKVSTHDSSANQRYFSDDAPTETTTLRLGLVYTINKRSYSSQGWDGVGLLYNQDYIPVSGSYYCPAHTADQTFEHYESAWKSAHGVIRGNYQYRGEGPGGEQRLDMVEPKTTALLSDSLRQIDEWSHQAGANVMTADLAVRWLPDPDEKIRASIPIALSASAPLPAEFNPQRYRFPIEQTWSIADSVIVQNR